MRLTGMTWCAMFALCGHGLACSGAASDSPAPVIGCTAQEPEACVCPNGAESSRECKGQAGWSECACPRPQDLDPSLPDSSCPYAGCSESGGCSPVRFPDLPGCDLCMPLSLGVDDGHVYVLTREYHLGPTFRMFRVDKCTGASVELTSTLVSAFQLAAYQGGAVVADAKTEDWPHTGTVYVADDKGGFHKLVDDDDRPTQVAAYGTKVAWSTYWSTIKGADRETYKTWQFEFTGVSYDSQVLVDDTYVYFEAGGAIYKALAGNQPEAVKLADGCIGMETFRADSSNLYWADGCGGVYSIRSVPKAGGAVSILTQSTQAWSLGVDRRRVYWTDGSSVLAVDKTGGQALTVTSDDTMRALAVDNAAVYWGTQNRVVKLAKPP